MSCMFKVSKISQLPFKGLQACSDMQDCRQVDECICLQLYAALAAQSDKFRTINSENES